MKKRVKKNSYWYCDSCGYHKVFQHGDAFRYDKRLCPNCKNEFKVISPINYDTREVNPEWNEDYAQ
jgi:hypothetical protein